MREGGREGRKEGRTEVLFVFRCCWGIFVFCACACTHDMYPYGTCTVSCGLYHSHVFLDDLLYDLCDLYGTVWIACYVFV